MEVDILCRRGRHPSYLYPFLTLPRVPRTASSDGGSDVSDEWNDADDEGEGASDDCDDDCTDDKTDEDDN